MRVLVLGGYGLIGCALVRRLIDDGHEVTGLGRSAAKGRAVSANADWMSADIAQLSTPERWADILTDFDVVVNAAGVLQAGLADDVTAVQETAIIALVEACERNGTRQMIQISAPGVSETSDTEFYRTKSRADEAIKASKLNWVIFRPGLVISPQAYGGTSLLRLLAAFPVVQPILFEETPIQTVSIDDVASAVSFAISENLSGADHDLVSPETTTLGDTLSAFRSWLGFAPARAQIPVPKWCGYLIAKGADIAGWLGWRTALRTTSLKVLEYGIRGDSTPWAERANTTLKTLSQTLETLPSTAQERIYARTMLAFPFLLITLSLFWIVSGLIGLVQRDAAIDVLGDSLPSSLGTAFVVGGSFADLAIGLALVYRPLLRPAALASILLSAGYLFGSLVTSPHLWSDPLGPMVKVFPAMALALAVIAIAEKR